MAVVFERPKALLDVPMHFCPGCGHGIVHRLVCEVLDEMGIEGNTIGVVPVGCSVMSYDYFGCDVIEAPHGRAPAVATGVKRSNPDKMVFTYQGDGDLAAIGTAETVHSGTRGENLVIIFINNTTYGMTGGQMAPTTMPGQVTQTTPYGRDPKYAGYPIRVCEMMSTLTGVALAQRVAVDSVPHIREAKKAIRKAFENEKAEKGLSIIEVLSTCPTNWGMAPQEAMQFVKDKMSHYYPLGVYKDGGMTTEFILAGFGGQGILFAGKILAYCGLMAGKELSWLPSYGPEMRGGTANCSVCISDEPIGSPLVTAPNCLIAMNGPSYTKFVNAVQPNGLILLDNSVVEEKAVRDDVKTISLPATDMATENGLNGSANMILLGRMLAETKLFDLDTVQKAMEKCIPPKRAHLIEANMKAVRIGAESK